MSTIEEVKTGWAPRSVTALGFAALSALFVLIFLYEDRSAAAGASGLWAFVTSTLIGHAVGGAAAGWLVAGLFGRAWIIGWLLAALGGIIASLLSGLLGGVLNSIPAIVSGASALADVISIGSAMFVMPFAIAAAPWLGLVWIGGIAAIHVFVGRARAL